MKLFCSKCWILSRGPEGKVNSTLSSGRGSFHQAAPLTNGASPCVFIQRFLPRQCFGCSRMKPSLSLNHAHMLFCPLIHSWIQLCSFACNFSFPPFSPRVIAVLRIIYAFLMRLMLAAYTVHAFLIHVNRVAVGLQSTFYECHIIFTQDLFSPSLALL